MVEKADLIESRFGFERLKPTGSPLSQKARTVIRWVSMACKEGGSSGKHWYSCFSIVSAKASTVENPVFSPWSSTVCSVLIIDLPGHEKIIDLNRGLSDADVDGLVVFIAIAGAFIKPEVIGDHIY